MILAQTAEHAPAIEPTLLVLLYIFGAALVTAIAGFALAAWQSKRDHARWLRERRYDGFTRILALANRYARYRQGGRDMMTRSEELQASHAGGDAAAGAALSELAEDMARHIERVNPLQDELGDVVAALEVLGPNGALEALNAFTDRFEEEDDAAIDVAKDDFIKGVREALGIKA